MPDHAPDHCEEPVYGTAIPLDLGAGSNRANDDLLRQLHSHGQGRGTLVSVIDTGSSAPGITGDRGHCQLHGTAVSNVISTMAPEATIVSWHMPTNPKSTHGASPLALVHNIDRALSYAADNGISRHIINISMIACDDHPAIRFAIEHAQATGALIVASAANRGQCEGSQQAYPAALPGVLAISAIETLGSARAGNIAPGSLDINRVPAHYADLTTPIDIFAPGGPVSAVLELPGEDADSPPRRETVIGGDDPFMGTSFAAPVVAGTAALAWEHAPQLGAAIIGSLLIQSAQPGGENPVTHAPALILNPLTAVTATKTYATALAAAQPVPASAETNAVTTWADATPTLPTVPPHPSYLLAAVLVAVVSAAVIVTTVLRARPAESIPPSGKSAMTLHATSAGS